MRGALVPVIVAVTLVESGCATRGSVGQVRAELAAVRQELAAVRESVDLGAKETARNIADLRALEGREREVNQSLAGLTREVGGLSTRLDETEAAVRATRAALDELRAATPPQPAPEKPAASEPAPRANAAEAVYASALALFRAREYGQAVLDFTDFVARYPKHPLVSSAQFWIGEAYYLQRDYRQAIAELQKTADVPASPKAPDALLRIGMSYAALRDASNAQQAWRRLVRDYPDTEAATRARALLRARLSSPASGPGR